MLVERVQRAQEDAEDLWRAVGLEELRQALNDVETLTRRFETSLQALPPCTACARINLLQEIRATGSRLGGKIVSLTVLAETLKGAVVIAEQAAAQLATNVPDSCQCPGTQCTCHG